MTTKILAIAEALKAERSAADLYGYYEGGLGTRSDYERTRARTDAAIADALAAVPAPTEAEWRKAIADQVRRNCTIDWDTVQKGGDALIYAVCDWIENPPAWSSFTPPAPAPKTQDGEAEWEYAGKVGTVVGNTFSSRVAAEEVLADANASKASSDSLWTLVRRRPASPWVPVSPEGGE